MASVTLKKLIQQFQVDSQKTFVTKGIRLYTKATTQVVNKWEFSVSLDSQLNKFIKINSHGLCDKNFSITVFENRFPKFSDILSGKNGSKQSTKCPAIELIFLAAFRNTFFAYGLIGFVFQLLGLFSALLLFIRLIVSNIFWKDLSTFCWLFRLSLFSTLFINFGMNQCSFFYLTSGKTWLLEKEKENSSVFPFVYVTILIVIFSRLMCPS